jgi:hypothetical protein
MAQIFRATLLASAIATSMRGFIASIRESQDPCAGGLRPAQLTQAIAPMIRSLLMRPDQPSTLGRAFLPARREPLWIEPEPSGKVPTASEALHRW